jgi:hypothetical protein
MNQPKKSEIVLNPAEANAVKEVIKREPPEILYHYTNRPALVEILETRSVFASHIRYLNDAQEMAFAVRRVQEVLKNQAGTGDAEAKKVREELENWVRHLQPQSHVFVFSLSSEGDLLSQWRAYCRPSEGYSIGFDAKTLAGNAREAQFTMAPCIYDAAEQQRLLEQLIIDAIAGYRKHVADGHEPTDAIGAVTTLFLISLLIVASVIKDPAFAEEKEWRLVSQAYGFGDKRVLFRSGPRLLVPHVTLNLAEENQPLPIKEIVVGPTAHRKLEAEAVRGFLIRANAASHKFRLSQVPYRAW